MIADAVNDAASSLSIFEKLRSMVADPACYEDATNEFDVVAGKEVRTWLK